MTAAPHVVLIDDDPAILGLVGEMLSSHGMEVHSFSDGREAMASLQDVNAPSFDLLISDINMPGMNGFDIIQRVKAIHPDLPVVLMTGAATLDYAIRAMRMGAVNLFQKPLSLRDLVNNVFHLVELHREYRMSKASLKGLVKETRHFVYTSAELDIPSLVRHLTDRLVQVGFAQPSNVDVYAMAYHEALVNAHHHGNLELESRLKEDLFSADDAYGAMLKSRMADPAHAFRKVQVTSEMDAQEYRVTIRDEGKGFDFERYFQFSDDNIGQYFGRGLGMIRLIMDEVAFADGGREITLVVRKK